MAEFKLQQYNQKTYKVVDSVFVPDISYKLTKERPMFSEVDKGEVIAKSGESTIKSPSSGYVILAPKGINITKSTDEVLFITQLI